MGCRLDQRLGLPNRTGIRHGISTAATWKARGRHIVVDASIIPEPPSGFPNLITMMLAERIAATI